MTKPIAPTESILDASEHSPLFHWMVSNHKMLDDKASRGRMPWTRLCRSFAENGLTDITGKQPTPSTARQTWRRVRAFVAAEQARLEMKAKEMAAKQAESRARPPPRLPPGIVPVPVSISGPSPVRPGVPALVQRPSSGGQPVLLANGRPETPDEMVDRVIEEARADLQADDARKYRWPG